MAAAKKSGAWDANRTAPVRFSTRLRLLPTFFTAFFAAEAERPAFFASYRTP